MQTKDLEKDALTESFVENEAGVADMIELYERIESVYVKASEAVYDAPVTYTSDSTNITSPHAHLG